MPPLLSKNNWGYSMDVEWQKLREEVAIVGYKKVTTKYFLMPNGRETEFTTWHETSNNVTTIALTRDYKVLVARQFRPGPERVFEELPGGDAKPGETLAVSAARELLEETGYVSDEPYQFLGAAYRDAYSNETDNYYLATNCHKVTEEVGDDNEFIEVTQITIKQLIENAKIGKMTDSVAVLMALEKLKEYQNA